jgi:hypothetical protein
MTGTEKKLDRLLSTAHVIAWRAGRYDLATAIIRALNCLRYAPPKPAQRLDDDQFDCEEEAASQQINLNRLLKGN